MEGEVRCPITLEDLKSAPHIFHEGVGFHLEALYNYLVKCPHFVNPVNRLPFTKSDLVKIEEALIAEFGAKCIVHRDGEASHGANANATGSDRLSQSSLLSSSVVGSEEWLEKDFIKKRSVFHVQPPPDAERAAFPNPVHLTVITDITIYDDTESRDDEWTIGGSSYSDGGQTERGGSTSHSSSGSEDDTWETHETPVLYDIPQDLDIILEEDAGISAAAETMDSSSTTPPNTNTNECPWDDFIDTADDEGAVDTDLDLDDGVDITGLTMRPTPEPPLATEQKRFISLVSLLCDEDRQVEMRDVINLCQFLENEAMSILTFIVSVHVDSNFRRIIWHHTSPGVMGAVTEYVAANPTLENLPTPGSDFSAITSLPEDGFQLDAVTSSTNIAPAPGSEIDRLRRRDNSADNSTENSTETPNNSPVTDPDASSLNIRVIYGASWNTYREMLLRALVTRYRSIVRDMQIVSPEDCRLMLRHHLDVVDLQSTHPDMDVASFENLRSKLVAIIERVSPSGST